jgi:TrmH family RNA methyltransferase
MDISLKQIKALRTKKTRDESGLFIAEGARVVAEIPQSWGVRAFVCSEGYRAAHAECVEAYKKRAECVVVPDGRFASLSDTETPQGVMAICEKKTFALDASPSDRPLVLFCENLSDPGNVGTLIRTAAAARADRVVLSAGCAEAYSPKVVRASAGAVFHIPVIENADTEETFAYLRARGVMVIAADASGTVLPYALDLRAGCAFAVGSEARGLSDTAKAAADALVRLPMDERAESLNASVAGGILLYEAVRQRNVCDVV